MSQESDTFKTRSRGRIESEFVVAAAAAAGPLAFLVEGDDRIIAGACPLSPVPSAALRSPVKETNFLNSPAEIYQDEGKNNKKNDEAEKDEEKRALDSRVGISAALLALRSKAGISDGFGVILNYPPTTCGEVYRQPGGASTLPVVSSSASVLTNLYHHQHANIFESLKDSASRKDSALSPSRKAGRKDNDAIVIENPARDNSNTVRPPLAARLAALAAASSCAAAADHVTDVNDNDLDAVKKIFDHHHRKRDNGYSTSSPNTAQNEQVPDDYNSTRKDRKQHHPNHRHNRRGAALASSAASLTTIPTTTTTTRGLEGGSNGSSGCLTTLNYHQPRSTPRGTRTEFQSHPQRRSFLDAHRRHHRNKEKEIETVVIDLSSEDDDNDNSLGALKSAGGGCAAELSTSDDTPTTRRSSRLEGLNDSSEDALHKSVEVEEDESGRNAEEPTLNFNPRIIATTSCSPSKKSRIREEKVPPTSESPSPKKKNGDAISPSLRVSPRRRSARHHHREEEEEEGRIREEDIFIAGEQRQQQRKERKKETRRLDSLAEEGEFSLGDPIASSSRRLEEGEGSRVGLSKELSRREEEVERRKEKKRNKKEEEAEDGVLERIVEEERKEKKKGSSSSPKRKTRERKSKLREKDRKKAKLREKERKKGQEKEGDLLGAPRDYTSKANCDNVGASEKADQPKPVSSPSAEVVVLESDADKDDLADSTKALTDSAVSPQEGEHSIVFLGMDGPSDNLRSTTAVNMHQRKWKRSVDYIGNWMVSKCPHDMMVKQADANGEPEDVIVISPDILYSQPTCLTGGSRKRNRQDRSQDSAAAAVGVGVGGGDSDMNGGVAAGSDGSAFLDSFLKDQHLKRMKLNDESAGLATAFAHPPSSSSSSPVNPDPRADPFSGLSTTSTPFFSASPEECINRISANHVMLVDLDSWGRPLVEIGDNWRPFPKSLFIYGFSSSKGGCGGGGGGGFLSLVSTNSTALKFIQRISADCQFLLHRQPEFGAEMILRYQAGRLDVVLDVATAISILVGEKSSLQEIHKQFNFNAMKSMNHRRDIVILDPRSCTLNTLVERIVSVAGKGEGNPTPTTPSAVGDVLEEESQQRRQQQQPQPIVIDP